MNRLNIELTRFHKQHPEPDSFWLFCGTVIAVGAALLVAGILIGTL